MEQTGVAIEPVDYIYVIVRAGALSSLPMHATRSMISALEWIRAHYEHSHGDITLSPHVQTTGMFVYVRRDNKLRMIIDTLNITRTRFTDD